MFLYPYSNAHWVVIAVVCAAVGYLFGKDAKEVKSNAGTGN